MMIGGWGKGNNKWETQYEIILTRASYTVFVLQYLANAIGLLLIQAVIVLIACMECGGLLAGFWWLTRYCCF